MPLPAWWSRLIRAMCIVQDVMTRLSRMVYWSTTSGSISFVEPGALTLESPIHPIWQHHRSLFFDHIVRLWYKLDLIRFHTK